MSIPNTVKRRIGVAFALALAVSAGAGAARAQTADAVTEAEARFKEGLRRHDAGDEEGARLQEQVGREEIAHVRFGVTWFRAFRSTFDFDTWQRALVPPLSPLLMRGQPLQREARRRAGQSEDFLAELEAWQPDSPGS